MFEILGAAFMVILLLILAGLGAALIYVIFKGIKNC